MTRPRISQRNYRVSSARARRRQRQRAFIRGSISLKPERLESRIVLATITGEDPGAGTHDASTATNISATYDEVITGASNQSFSARSIQGGHAPGTVTFSGMDVTLDPASDFFPGDVVEVTSTSGVQGTSAGVPHVWRFRTAAGGSADFVDSGQGLGDPAANTPSWSVEVGDLDGDGDLDVFMSNFGANRVYLNDGSGVFSDSGQTLGNNFSRQAALGDLDGDGDIDVLVANDNGQSGYGTGVNRIWLNDGNAVFTEQTFGGRRSRDVALGDLDADGDLDVIVANSADGNRVYLNNGSGGIADSGQSLGTYNTQGMALGDLDGDGDLDVIFANGGNAGEDEGHRATVWINQGGAQGGSAGTFVDSGLRMEQRRVRGFDVGDLDGDGDLDAFMSSADYANKVWLNDGTGVLTDSGQDLGASRTEKLKLGDLDGDGDLDAFVINNNGANNRVWLNDGAGVFSDPGLSLDLNSNSNDVALGDVNGDGTLDAVVANDNTFVAGASVGRIWINRSLVPSVTLGIDNPTIGEDAGVATVTATLSAAHTQAVTVALGFGGTATNTEDYTASATEIVINTGATTGSVTVTSVQDSGDEPDETVIVEITAVTNGQESGAQQVTTTILDDDEPIPVPDVTLAVDNPNIPENGGLAVFTISLSEVTTIPVTVDLAISGTAGAGDFNASSTQVVVAAGATSETMTVTAVDDDGDEPDESVIVEITNVVGGNEVGDQQQTTTITDDDEPVMPDVTLTADVSEIGEAGGEAILTVTLSEVTTAPVTVELEISGTATAGDFTTSATQIVIAAGSTTGTVTLTAIQDDVNEPDETVIVDVLNVTGGNEAGVQQQTITILDDDIPPTFAVTSLEAHPSGFRLEFANPIDASEVNLFDTQNAAMGPADLVVAGAASGPITGSLVMEESAVTFIKSGDPLEPDTYTVMLRSADNGFKDTTGALLDGDGDGTAGDDYVDDFTIDAAPADARTIQLPDFVRGPGQDVNLPANTTTGIPISISDGTEVRAVDLRIGYDPALLEITDATAPGGGTVVLNTTTPGLAILVYFNSSPLPAGESVFITLEANIPTDNASQNYASQQVLDVHGVIVGDGNDNEFPVVVDDALHLATFFSDVSGNGRTNAGDASQVARFAALIDSGFVGSLLTDPNVIGDISGNGRINAADASLVARFAALIPVDQIPDIPGGVLIAGLPPAFTPGHVPGTSPADRDGRASQRVADLDQGSFPVIDRFLSESSTPADEVVVDEALNEERSFLTDLEQVLDELFSG